MFFPMRRKRARFWLVVDLEVRILGSAHPAIPASDGARLIFSNSDAVAVEPFVAAVAPLMMMEGIN